MKNEKATKLIKKYLDNTCSEEERALAESWYIKAAEMEPDEPGDPDYLSIEKEILQALREKQIPVAKSKRIWPHAAAVAAILFIIVSAGLYFYITNSLHTGERKQRIANRIHHIVPGGNKAILTLADGSTISLSDAVNGQLAEQAGVVIKKSAKGQLVYTVKDQSDAKNKFNTISTPRGGQFVVYLPDGTKVWLNASSSLRYPITFLGKDRKVELNGEAYFEVATDKKHPFKVLSNQQTVEVLGTHFNISSYNDEDSWKTTLLEGSVKVFSSKKSLLLEPGQEARIGKNELISVSEVDTEEAVAWKNGYFRFKSEEIESIMRKVSRWYDVDVEYKGGITNEKFNGTISRNKNISQILEMLETTNAVHFKIEGRRVTVMK